MRFSELRKLDQPNLLVSRAHDKWMVEDGRYTVEAKQFMSDQMNSVPRKREGTVSASSLGDCKRKQQFVWAGVKQKKLEPKGAAIFRNGDFVHLRWQMSGISAGWLTKAEVPIPVNEHNLKGTMDGVLYEDSILEIKSINDNGYRGVQLYGPQKKHLFQGAAYALTTGREKVVFVYENKNTQEYSEHVVGREELPLEEAAKRAGEIHAEIEAKHLVEPLSKCIDKEGFDYTYCPFAKVCLGIKTWEDMRAHHQAGEDPR